MRNEHHSINVGDLLMERHALLLGLLETKELCLAAINEFIVLNFRYWKSIMSAIPVIFIIIFLSNKLCDACFYFQSVVAPNGLIAHMFEPIEGRRHDAFMLAASGLLDKLEPFRNPGGEPYVLYGDPAYGISHNILAPFRGAQLTDDQKEFNKRMSKVRVSVEWGFGKIIQNFAFLDFRRNLKILLQPFSKYYIVASLLKNCPTCLYGSLTGTYFGVDPPSLETFLCNE
jgi:hypothetical protein